MSDIKVVALSLDADTTETIDAYARQLENENPGVRISRSEAARAYVKRARSAMIKAA